MLESIRIWGHLPLYQRRESNATSLLDIDDRSIKFKSRCIEVNNSKKLIEYTMEENYRLLFDLPLLERKKEVGKDRLRNTIMRKFGRHQAKDKIERSPSVVSLSSFVRFQPMFNHQISRLICTALTQWQTMQCTLSALKRLQLI